VVVRTYGEPDQRVTLLQRASLRNMRLSSSPGDLPSKTAWFGGRRMDSAAYSVIGAP
jgi:hypothetical protein